MYEVVRILVWVIGIPIILFLIWQIIQRVRAIRELDARLREEEAQQAKNPYAELAKLAEVQQLLDQAKGKKKP